MLRWDGWAAFQPPSDMSGGDGGGGSKAKKIWVGLGIGCAAILLIVGIAFALGAFKAVSCCQDFQGAMVKTQGAQQFGSEFAQMLRAGELEAAYQATTPSFQERMSLEDFKGAVAAHRQGLAAGPPVTTNFMARNKPNEDFAALNEWRMTAQYVGSTDETLAVQLTITVQGEGDAAEFKIDDLQFENQVRNFASEGPAQEVLGVHDLLRSESYDMAYGRMGAAFTQETDREAFQAFVEKAGPILTDSQLEIRDIDYGPQGRTATVMAQATTTAGKNAIVQYELVQEEAMGFQAWRIVAIAPLVAEDQPPAAAKPDAGKAAPAVDAGP